MMEQDLRQHGFTLIEVLVYLGIFLIVSTSAVTFLVSFDDFIREYRVETALYRSGTSVLEQVQLALRQGEVFDTLSSLTATTSGALAITNGTSSTVLAKVGDELQLTKNGIYIGNLLADEVIVTEFVVFHYPLALGEAARVRLGLEATVGSTTKNITLHGGAVLRDSI